MLVLGIQSIVRRCCSAVHGHVAACTRGGNLFPLVYIQRREKPESEMAALMRMFGSFN